MAMKTAEDLRNLVKSVRDKTFPYEKREEKNRNWHQYDQAQVNEIADVLETIRDVVNIAASRIPEKKKGPGRPPVPSQDILKVMLMQAYFGMPNRIAEGFLRLFGEKLGISSEFSYKTIERGYDPERTEKILDGVLRIMNEAGNPLENIFSTDGTGDPNTMKVNYESKRSQQRMEKEKNKDGKESDAFPYTKGKHDFQYSSFSTGVHTKIISGYNGTYRKYVPKDGDDAWRHTIFQQEDLFHCGRIRHNTIFPSKDKCNIPCKRCGIMEVDAVQIHAEILWTGFNIMEGEIRVPQAWYS